MTTLQASHSTLPTSLPWSRSAHLPNLEFLRYRSLPVTLYGLAKQAAEKSPPKGDPSPSPAALSSAAEVEALSRYIQALEHIRSDIPSAYFFNPAIGGPLTELFTRLKRRQHAVASQGPAVPALLARLGAIGQGLDRYTVVPLSLLNPFFWLQMPFSLALGGKDLQEKARTLYQERLSKKEKDRELLPDIVKASSGLQKKPLVQRTQRVKSGASRDKELRELAKSHLKELEDMGYEVEPLTEKEKLLTFMRGERPDFAVVSKALGNEMVGKLSAAEIDAFARALADRARLAALKALKSESPVQYYLNPLVGGPLSQASLSTLERVNRNQALDPHRQARYFTSLILPAGVLTGLGLYQAISNKENSDQGNLHALDPIIAASIYQFLRGVDAGLYGLTFNKDLPKSRQREKVLSTIYDETLRKASR